MSKNGGKEVEHPKTVIEVMEGTRGSVAGYAQAQRIPEAEAALILMLNELRCIHWHLDSTMVRETADQV